MRAAATAFRSDIPDASASLAVFDRQVRRAILAARARGIPIWQSGLGITLLINIVFSLSVRGISIGGHLGGVVGGLITGARIVELAGNAVLAKVWRSLEPFSRTYLSLVVPGADPTWSASLHDPILERLRERDPEAVAQALARHFIEAG